MRWKSLEILFFSLLQFEFDRKCMEMEFLAVIGLLDIVT